MTVIFLPPAGLDRHCWDMTGLRGEMYEYPGLGERPLGPAGTFTMEMLSDHIAASYTGDLHLVGCAMGGLVAQNVAVRYPQRIKSMLLASTRADGGKDSDEAVWPRKMLFQRADAALRLGMQGVLDSTLERWFPSESLKDPGHWGAQYARKRLLANDPAAFAACWTSTAHSSARDLLPDVQIPVTVLAGRHDLASPIEKVFELYALFSNSRLEVIDGGHVMPIERPDEFSYAVHRHFDWINSIGQKYVPTKGRLPLE